MPPTHRTTGRVEAVAENTLTLTHPEIPALKWPGMTMDFELASDLAGPKPPVGSNIEFEFRLRKDEAPQIVQWRARQNNTLGGPR